MNRIVQLSAAERGWLAWTAAEGGGGSVFHPVIGRDFPDAVAEPAKIS
jgi:hypothetical protein